MAEHITDPVLQDAVTRVAPGTNLREAIDMIIAARIGALICIGDTEAVAAISDGGFLIRTPFSSQKLFELAKMDGAIILDDTTDKIIAANIHLMPDPNTISSETGMRHRTAEQVSRQTDALVISISQRRDAVGLYRNGNRVFLQSTELLLSKANQAIQTLQNYRARFDESLMRLNSLEISDLVTLGDLTAVISRFEMLHRVQLEIERYIAQLGTDGRLVKMQADEITASMNEICVLVIRDYAKSDDPAEAKAILKRLNKLPLDDLFEPGLVARELGYKPGDAPEEHIASRGYRVMARIPLLPKSIVSRLVKHFGSLSEIARATPAAIDDIEGVSNRRAQAIVHALSQFKDEL